MSFQEAITSVFQKYVCFSGRARRSEFWYFALLNYVVAAVLAAVYSYSESRFASLLSSLWGIAMFLPALGVAWRRLHDIGRSGAWWFLNFLPLVGQIILIIWLCKDSQPGPNQYGDNPKYPSGRYGYNPYGQNNYNQNTYNQNSYNQNTYNQNPYGQNGYNQNPYGQNSYDPNANSQNGGQNNYDWKP